LRYYFCTREILLFSNLHDDSVLQTFSVWLKLPQANVDFCTQKTSTQGCRALVTELGEDCRFWISKKNSTADEFPSPLLLLQSRCYVKNVDWEMPVRLIGVPGFEGLIIPVVLRTSMSVYVLHWHLKRKTGFSFCLSGVICNRHSVPTHCLLIARTFTWSVAGRNFIDPSCMDSYK
jgi:hypothetical protein